MRRPSSCPLLFGTFGPRLRRDVSVTWICVALAPRVGLEPNPSELVYLAWTTHAGVAETRVPAPRIRRRGERRVPKLGTFSLAES